MEDFELRNLLAARKPLTAGAIADTLVTGGRPYADVFEVCPAKIEVLQMAGNVQ